MTKDACDIISACRVSNFPINNAAVSNISLQFRPLPAYRLLQLLNESGQEHEQVILNTDLGQTPPLQIQASKQVSMLSLRFVRHMCSFRLRSALQFDQTKFATQAFI